MARRRTRAPIRHQVSLEAIRNHFRAAHGVKQTSPAEKAFVSDLELVWSDWKRFQTSHEDDERRRDQRQRPNVRRALTKALASLEQASTELAPAESSMDCAELNDLIRDAARALKARVDYLDRMPRRRPGRYVNVADQTLVENLAALFHDQRLPLSTAPDGLFSSVVSELKPSLARPPLLKPAIDRARARHK